MTTRGRARLLDVLQRRADAHGKVQGTTEEIRRELALTRHDLTKALYDLKALGQVQFTEVRNGTQTHLARIELRSTRRRNRPAKDHQLDILTWLELAGGQGGSWVSVTPRAMADDIGLSYGNLMALLRKMASRGDLDIQYKGRGVRSGLDSIRVLAWATSNGSAPARGMDSNAANDMAAGHETPATVPVPAPALSTPHLDAYRAARAFAAEYPDNPYLQWEPVAIVEEALALLDKRKETP